MAKNLVELCPHVLWKIESVNNEIGYLAEEISRQNVEGAAWVLLTTNSEIQEETYELNKELLNRKEVELKNLENSQPIHIAKDEKACFE